MTSLFGASKLTIERRLADHNSSIRNTYSEISDIKLEERVRGIVQEFPNIGYWTVSSMMMADGYRIQEYRLRNAVRTSPK